MTDQQATTVAHPAEEPAKKASRAGRNLPAAIAVGAVLGFSLIAILLYAPYVWIPVVAVAIAVATHEVVRRLRTAGFVIPLIPLLVGGQATIWLSWPWGVAGALGGFGGADRKVRAALSPSGRTTEGSRAAGSRSRELAHPAAA